MQVYSNKKMAECCVKNRGKKILKEKVIKKQMKNIKI